MPLGHRRREKTWFRRQHAKTTRRHGRRISGLQDRQRRGARPQSLEAFRAGRSRLNRVNRSRRCQGGALLGRRRDHRGDQYPYRPDAPLDDRPDPLRRGAGLAHARLRRSVEQHGLSHARAGRGSGRRARPRRQPLQGPRVVGEPLLRFLEAGLPRHGAVGRGHAAAYRRARRAHAPEGGVLFAPGVERAVAVQLSHDQP